MRALIVDDSKSMRMILGRTLREAGFEVTEAGDWSTTIISFFGDNHNLPVARG